MRRWWDRRSFARVATIRGRLVVYLALAVVLTAVAVSVVTFVLGSRDGRSRVVGQLSSVVGLKEQEIKTWRESLYLNLDIVLRSPTVPADLHSLSLPATTGDAVARQAAYDRAQEFFSWAVTRVGLFQEVFFMDRQGSVLVSTTRSHEGNRLGLNGFFVEGLKKRYIEQPSYSLPMNKMTIVASTPVKEGSETIGVLAGLADLSGLNRIMIETPSLGETGETYLVGLNYRLLTNLRHPGYLIPDTYVRTDGTQAAINGRWNGSATYESYAGPTVIGVYSWIPELQVALMAEQEEAEALGPTRRALWIIGGVAIVAAVLAIMAGVGLTRRIVRPLAQLGDTAGRIADGELDLRATVVREDEIGGLAHAFNRMTGQLSALVASLQRRTEHLRAIDETGQQISSILELEQLLPYVAKSILETFGYETVRVFHLTDCCSGRLVTCARHTCEPSVEVNLTETLDLDGSPSPIGIPGEGPSLNAIATVVQTEDAVIPEKGGLELAVPIRAGDRLAGVLEIVAPESRPLDDEDMFAARTLADQLAIAIENSRLYEQASDLAASQERQRLARDLHDAVSQTLFSVSLIAEVLPRIYARDPEQGAQRLEELRQLTRGALAEMRTLLLELRPAALAEANLPDLLRQLGEAVTGRARIPVEVVTTGSGELPTDVRIAFYRIAQEALNNVGKHSGASRARVHLTPMRQDEDGDFGSGDFSAGASLSVEDDGAGFDPAAAGGGQLGLGIMRERAEAVGAQLSIHSVLGQGTKVVLTWAPIALSSA